MIVMINKPREVAFHSWRYRQLFWSIIALFIFPTFTRFQFSSIITSTLFTLTILLMVRNLSIRESWKFFLRILVAIALGCDLLTLFINNPIISEKLFTLADIVYAVFLGATIFMITQQLNNTKNVDQDVLLGAISVYILIGILWFLLYRISFIINPNNFTELVDENLSSTILLYFSFTTLTTVGYGDISPTDALAMGLSNSEAMIGQLYPAIFLARLVSLYILHLEEEKKED